MSLSRSRMLAQPAGPAALTVPTPAQITAVTDILEHRWSENALLAQERYQQAIQRDDHNAAAKWAVSAAISTDKILILKGRPTDIVGHVHAHRHDLSAVMDKLAGTLRRTEVNRPVTHPDSPRSTPLAALGPVIEHALGPGTAPDRAGH